MRFIFSLYLFFFSFSLAAQNIISGPIIGAVTDHSATIIVQISGKGEVKLLVENGKEEIQVEKEIRSNGFVAFEISNLEPYQDYKFNVSTTDQQLAGNFKTFPKVGEKGTYTFVTGSCQETDNMKVFEVMPKHDPLFFMHLGDYAYPDVKLGDDYTSDYTKVAEAYNIRYNENIMKEMLTQLPINYVFDDHDHVNNDSGRFHSSGSGFERKGMMRTQNYFTVDTFPYAWHRNAVKGYCEFFPHYEMPDTAEAIHHSFKMGNAEFFVLDRCSSRPQPTQALFEQNKRGRWRFRPKPEHQLFGEKQLDWLKEGLKNSTADWKFIVSGVPLNKNMVKLIHAGVSLQRFSAKGYSAFKMAAGYSNYWAGFPHEMADFYAFLEQENIKDVIVISGDTHHNVMDDGKNAGLPELNTSGLSVGKTHAAKYVKLIGMMTLKYRLKKKVWNQGGNGLGSKNIKNGFGKVRIEKDEYVELSIIDEDNEVVKSFRVYHSTKKD